MSIIGKLAVVLTQCLSKNFPLSSQNELIMHENNQHFYNMHVPLIVVVFQKYSYLSLNYIGMIFRYLKRVLRRPLIVFGRVAPNERSI